MDLAPPIAQLNAEWLLRLPVVIATFWVFVFGLSIGSFLNVLIARLPFEKSPFWPPGSRCFSCLRPLRFADNLPVIGYLRLRGRCRFCKSPFSSRYMWIELSTGLAFVGLFWVEVVENWLDVPGLRARGPGGIPLLDGWFYAAAHTYLLAMLIAAGVIDADYRIIPTHITYSGTLIGLGVSVLLPWPWPSSPAAAPVGAGWLLAKIPNGVALWPAWVPPEWAPAGSWQLGLLTGLAGAAAGMFVIRTLKFVFEYGFGQEAVGLGDADLLMMAGAFLGWQPVVLAVPVGAMVTLVVLPFVFAWVKIRGRSFPRHIPFGPGLAAGVVVVWLGWPILGELVRAVFFQGVLLLFGTVGMFGMLLVAGRLLRRGEPVNGEP